MSPDASRADHALPDIDDRLVAPETRYEVHDGELVVVSPANPPHATRHVQLAALIEAHTGPEFETAADLLTRTSEVDDIAPDVSVYPDAPDPATGRRQLEQLAFEIASTQSLGNAGPACGCNAMAQDTSAQPPRRRALHECNAKSCGARRARGVPRPTRRDPMRRCPGIGRISDACPSIGQNPDTMPQRRAGAVSSEELSWLSITGIIPAVAGAAPAAGAYRVAWLPGSRRHPTWDLDRDRLTVGYGGDSVERGSAAFIVRDTIAPNLRGTAAFSLRPSAGVLR